MLIALLAFQILATTPAADPFAFFQPAITITQADRRQLDRGEPIASLLPAADSEVAVFAAIRVDVDGDRLVAWMRRVEALKQSSYVLGIGRFSDPPIIEDLAGLTLDEEDLSAVRACRPGTCGLKLADAEIARLQRAVLDGGPGWKPAVQQAFRLLLLNRVQGYLARGDSALPTYDDSDGQSRPAASLARLLGRSGYLTQRLPQFAEHLGKYPQGASPGVESFIYWSKERLAGKTIISATHVNILRNSDASLPDPLVVAKQLFTTHYVNAALAITAIVRGGADAQKYLVYLNQSDVDMLSGTFGGITRWFVQRRVKGEASSALQGLRRRLEGGPPPNVSAMPSR